VPTYATAAELRAEPDVPDDLPDAEADRLLALAEDRVDEALGARAIDAATGRKVAQADVQDWQWAKVKRATVRCAARVRANPHLDENAAQQFISVTGPDFSWSRNASTGGSASVDDDPLGDDVRATVLASRLTRAAARVGGRRWGRRRERRVL
jgi:hypothetical protein